METTSNRPTPAPPDVVIPDRLFFRIGDVAELLGVKPYVLRYWETEFPMVAPQKSDTGQRVYRRGDVETLALIRQLLYGERYSIEGARKRLRELRREGKLKQAKAAVGAPGEMPGDAIEALLARPLSDFFPLIA